MAWFILKSGILFQLYTLASLRYSEGFLKLCMALLCTALSYGWQLIFVFNNSLLNKCKSILFMTTKYYKYTLMALLSILCVHIDPRPARHWIVHIGEQWTAGMDIIAMTSML